MLRLVFSFLLVLLSASSYAENFISAGDLKYLPVLHEGRIKPLDSFARIELLKFAKREAPNDIIPIEWLANSLFNPAEAINEKIFLVDNAETRHLLGLEERKKAFYSYVELLSGLDKTRSQIPDLIEKDNLSKDQKLLLSVHENVLQYTKILRSFSSVLPLNIDLSVYWRNQAGLSDQDNITFSDLQKIAPEVEDKIKIVIKKKGQDPAKYNSDEQMLVTLGWQIRTIAEAGNNNTLLRVIPLADNSFASPWELFNDGKANIRTQETLNHWIHLANAWQSQSQDQWEHALDKINNEYKTLSPENYNAERLWLETVYNTINPFKIAILLFSASFILSILFFINRSHLIYHLGFYLLIGAVTTQFIGLGFRIYLTDRPPVGTLYESILFVALISPLLSIFVERLTRNGVGIISGSIAGTMLGILGISLMGEGDNIKVLGAVLNTRFWLATHVLCITIGYGWCLLTSVLAHVALIGEATKKINKESHNQLIKIITTHALFSLAFTVVGTILGGIWADQSWGRFWGWDPKENGALLIVLWLIWLIHGKIAGQISNSLWLAGMAMLSVIVGLAWVGVNLLGVGLHSYGFIEGVFWGLGLFSLFEILVIGLMVVGISRHKKVLSHEI